jgi:AcrR family transcriptional regulator
MDTATKRKPRTQPPEKRRDDLMNAAQQLFVEHGIPGTTIEQIALGADLSKGAFYLHFDTKEEIHLALCDRFHKRFNGIVREAVAKRPKNDWGGKIRAWVRACVTTFLDEGDLVNALFHTHPVPPSSGWDSVVGEPLLELLEEGEKEGAWKLADTRFSAIFLHSGLHGVVDDALTNQRRSSRTQLIREVENMCMTILGISKK